MKFTPNNSSNDVAAKATRRYLLAILTPHMVRGTAASTTTRATTRLITTAPIPRVQGTRDYPLFSALRPG